MGHRMLRVLLLGTVFSFAAEGNGQEAGPTKAQTGVPFDLVSDFLVVVNGRTTSAEPASGKDYEFQPIHPDGVGGRHGTSRGTDSGPGSAGDGYEPGQIL